MAIGAMGETGAEFSWIGWAEYFLKAIHFFNLEIRDHVGRFSNFSTRNEYLHYIILLQYISLKKP